ncbi:DUF3907 family protein [Longirhabdus pacifica]|uniref:DUF3907 family protein n=1 Tax=Longirhabdus pacifica TaxID=2305227 RepID=UPI001008C914|nr:DUF3907 family protein [Longirhabdus pacifica]
MVESQVKQLCKETKESLKQVISYTETFLNHHSLKDLEKNGETELEQFYSGYLSDLRHLLVFSEVEYEKLGIALRRPEFNLKRSEKILYNVYHRCVNNFFYPKHESYAEDGRYAYTGQDAICFRKKPDKDAKELTLKLSSIFENMRESLAYYENDYVTQKRLQGESV